MKTLVPFLLLFAVPFSREANAADPPIELHAGPWRAWLESPGGELPFGIELQRQGDAWRAWLINGRERIEVPKTGWRDGKFVLDIEHYDSLLSASVSVAGARLDGEWTKTTTGGKVSRLAFHATAGASARFPQVTLASGDTLKKIEGRWAVKFAADEEPALADFAVQPDGVVEGTIMSATGDYGFLAGQFEQGRLRLSNFDGAHAFLFDARLKDDGTLGGDFWSRDAFHDTWTGKVAPDAKLPDHLESAEVAGAISFGSLSFPDVDGKGWSLADERFSGKARVIEIFGSWCPNCADEASTLTELYHKYHDKGLSVMGLAFELTGDAPRDARLVRKYVERHKVDYPVLIAGVADKAKATAALPFLKELKGYPTTIFTDSAGNIVATHLGFSGPATGEEHQRLKARFEGTVRQLLELPGLGEGQ